MQPMYLSDFLEYYAHSEIRITYILVKYPNVRVYWNSSNRYATMCYGDKILHFGTAVYHNAHLSPYLVQLISGYNFEAENGGCHIYKLNEDCREFVLAKLARRVKFLYPDIVEGL